jgi:hypothetical protein
MKRRHAQKWLNQISRKKPATRYIVCP